MMCNAQGEQGFATGSDGPPHKPDNPAPDGFACGGRIMIRIALLASGFLVCVAALILLQPGGTVDAPQAAALPDETVTRSDTGYDAFESLSENLSHLNATLAAQAGTGSGTAAAQEPAGEAALAVIADAPAAPPTREAGLEKKIISALSQPAPEPAKIAPAANVAASGTERTPETLVLADGRVNTALLLSALQPGAGATGQPRVHVVEPGDSLKALSYRFYDSTAHVGAILEANRDTLTATAQLGAGMRLIIPPLD